MYGQRENQREDGMVAAPSKLLISLVPEAGLEPAQGCPYRILSPARLPFHHSGTELILITKGDSGFKSANAHSKFEVQCSKVFQIAAHNLA